MARGSDTYPKRGIPPHSRLEDPVTHRGLGARTRLALAGSVVALAGLLVPNVASAATCSVVDPACSASLTGSDDPVGDAAGSVTGTVTDGVGTATDTGAALVDRANDTVSDVFDRVGGGPDTGGDGGDGGTTPGAHNPGGRHASIERGSGVARVPSPGAVRAQRSSSDPAGDGGAPSAVDVAKRGRTPGGFFASPLGRTVVEAAKRLAFPVGLLVLVLGFIVVQHRIDRRSPKIAVAHVDRDLVRFS